MCLDESCNSDARYGCLHSDESCITDESDRRLHSDKRCTYHENDRYLGQTGFAIQMRVIGVCSQTSVANVTRVAFRQEVQLKRELQVYASRQSCRSNGSHICCIQTEDAFPARAASVAVQTRDAIQARDAGVCIQKENAVHARDATQARDAGIQTRAAI